MNIIFLDVDGVLNTIFTEDRTPSGYRGIEKKYIEILKFIADRLKAKIVISSDWRYNVSDIDYKYLKDNLNEFGLEIYDVTPVISWRVRGQEIKQWLDAHKDEVDDYIIFDDNTFDFLSHKHLRKNVIITDEYADGIASSSSLFMEPQKIVSDVLSFIEFYKEKENRGENIN